MIFYRVVINRLTFDNMYKKYKFSVECLCNGEKEKMSFFYNLDYFYEIQVTSYNVVDSTEKLILQRKNNSQVM